MIGVVDAITTDASAIAPARSRDWIGLGLLALPCMLVRPLLPVQPRPTRSLRNCRPSTQRLWISDIYALVAGLLLPMPDRAARADSRRRRVRAGLDRRRAVRERNQPDRLPWPYRVSARRRLSLIRPMKLPGTQATSSGLSGSGPPLLQIPRATARCLGTWNIGRISESVDGPSIAAPTPIRPRQTIRLVAFTDSAAPIDASPKTAAPRGSSAPAAEPIGQHTHGQQQTGDQEHVDVGDPQQLGRARSQVRGEGGQGEVQQVGVDRDEQAGHGQQTKAEPVTAPRSGLRPRHLS